MTDTTVTEQIVTVGRRRYNVVFRDGWCTTCGGQHVGGWGRCECECHPATFAQLTRAEGTAGE